MTNGESPIEEAAAAPASTGTRRYLGPFYELGTWLNRCYQRVFALFPPYSG